MEEQNQEPSLVNTQFKDNHGIVVSGGNNTISVTFSSDGTMKAEVKKESREDRITRLTHIIQNLDSGRQMFCVLKGIMLAEKAGTLKDAEKVLMGIYPQGIPTDKTYDVNRLETTIHVLSLMKDVECWNQQDSPFKTDTAFGTFQYLTKQVKDIFTGL